MAATSPRDTATGAAWKRVAVNTHSMMALSGGSQEEMGRTVSPRQSVKWGSSIPRQDTTATIKTQKSGALALLPKRESMRFPLTAAGFDRLMVRIQWDIGQLQRAREAGVEREGVQARKTELDLGPYLDEMRNFLEVLLESGDEKQLLKEILGGERSHNVAHLQELCEKVELRIISDDRRKAVIRVCASVEKVLQDLGFGENMRNRKINVDAIEEGEEEENASSAGERVDEVIPHIAEAAFFGAEAMHMEEAGNMAEAVKKYSQASKAMRCAINVCRAMVKFKGSIGHAAAVVNDLQKMEVFDNQINERVELVQALGPGEKPSIPVEEQIQPLELDLHSDPIQRYKVITAYAGLSAAAGAASGVALGGMPVWGLGPFGLVLAAGVVGGTLMYNLHSDGAEEEEGDETGEQ